MKKKRTAAKLGILLSAAALLLGAGGCGRKSEDRVSAIREAGVFRAAIVNTESSYTHTDGDGVAGSEPELARYIGDALGVETEFTVCTRQEALNAVSAGEADIALGCINGSGSLSGSYLLSTPYGKGFFYAVTKKGDFVMTVGGLENSALGAASGMDEATRTQLYEADGISIVDYPSPSQAAADLKDGKIRAYICYERQAKELLADEALQVQNISNLEPEEYVIAAGPSDQTLTAGINTLIQQFLEGE